jgi:predicted PurR-regulated permease PerM
LFDARRRELVDAAKHASEHGGVFQKVDEGIAKPLAPFGIHPQSLSSHLVGTIGVGVTQGALATLAYWICGAPNPAFFGAMTAVASLVPGVGTLVIWVPLGIDLSATGHAGKGIALFSIGAFGIVAFCDGVLRPKLVGENENTGFFPTIVGLFGGIEIFGVMGLLIGPVIVGFSIAVLRLYLKEHALAAPKSSAR